MDNKEIILNVEKLHLSRIEKKLKLLKTYLSRYAVEKHWLLLANPAAARVLP